MTEWGKAYEETIKEEKIRERIKGISGIIEIALRDLYTLGFYDGHKYAYREMMQKDAAKDE